MVAGANARQLFVTGLRIQENQPAIFAPHDPVIRDGKKVIDPCPVTDVAGFDGRPFARRLSHATFISGFGGSSTLLNLPRAKRRRARMITKPIADQNNAQPSRQ